MPRRRYALGRRQQQVDQTRAHILEVARALLLNSSDPASFSINAVARQADVARMTVYNQFGSRSGLLEAVFDFLAVRGGLSRLPAAFADADPQSALATFVGAFCDFWSSERLVHRRLYALAALDPELERTLAARNERRREGLRVMVRRLALPADDAAFEQLIDVLHVLTSYQLFDQLATPERGERGATVLTEQLVWLVLRR